jgi:hypothetical protein
MLAAGCGEDMPVDPAVPVIESTNVADGATRVSVLTVFEATASGELDPASITRDSVRMVDERGVSIAGEVSYDEVTRVIRLQPIRPLSNNRTYQWQIAGVQASDGQPVEDVTVEFKTYVNPPVRAIRYDTETQEIMNYDLYLYEDDRQLGFDSYVTPGTDGQWFTGDDELGSYRRELYDAADQRYRSVRYANPGPDQAWFTEDDGISSYHNVIRDANGYPDKYLFYFGPGADNEWFNDDDAFLEVRDLTLRDDGRVESFSIYSDPGPDQTWLTEDDTLSLYEVTAFDEQGWITDTRRYDDAGPDEAWGTPDDVLVGYSSAMYDERGLEIDMIEFVEPGPDGEWFTDDDRQVSSRPQTYDEEGNAVERLIVVAGPDGEGGTADDAIFYRFEFDPTI